MKNLGFCLSSKSLLIFLYLYVFLSSKIEGFETLLQLPRSGSSEIRPRSSRVITIADFGAKGDGLTDDTQAFENAWKMACSCPARSILLVPAGFTSLVHPIDFAGPCRSKVTLQISGAIVSPKNPESWTGLNPRKWLYFHGVNHLQVEGGGTINGRGQKWWDCKVNKTSPYHRAPTAMTFHRCKNLKVHNLKLINSQQMHIAFTTCNQVKASHLEVIAPASSPNTDGIHISNSHNVKIKNSIVRTGDDCISIVSNSSKIQIRNIFCGPGHGISIGSLGESGSWVQVHDVKVDGAFLFNTDNGLRIKTWQGGNGFASDIKFQNILMENVLNPIIIDQYYCDSELPCTNQSSAVKVENISFVHIRGTSATEEAMIFACSDSFPCEGLYLEDIQLVSVSGGITESFCWDSYGSSSGLVYPPPCFSSFSSFINQKFWFKSAVQSL